MLDIGFFKGLPTDYVIRYSGGKVAQQGPGLSFYYLKHNTSIVAVPTSSTDANFVFNETTGNFQAVTIQGRSLEETLRDSQAIAGIALEQIRTGGLLASMGVELINVYFLSAKPTPEVAKALEAQYRERLLRQADEAIYARRAAAVEEERKIRENEQNTQIALEQQRQQLIALEGANAQQEAEFRGRALEEEAAFRARASEMELAVFRSMDPRTILALAMRELGRNAERVGNLTITSEVLASLLGGLDTGDSRER